MPRSRHDQTVPAHLVQEDENGEYIRCQCCGMLEPHVCYPKGATAYARDRVGEQHTVTYNSYGCSSRMQVR